MAPTCTNCGGTDFVWANDLKTGMTGGGTLSLRPRGEIPLGTRICRTCGKAELFMRDLTILHQPHVWRQGEFIPIPSRPKPAHVPPAPDTATPAAPPPAPEAAPPPPPPPPPPPEPAPEPVVVEPTPEPAAPPSEPAEASTPVEDAAETPHPKPKPSRRRTSRSKS